MKNKEKHTPPNPSPSLTVPLFMPASFGLFVCFSFPFLPPASTQNTRDFPSFLHLPLLSFLPRPGVGGTGRGSVCLCRAHSAERVFSFPFFYFLFTNLCVFSTEGTGKPQLTGEGCDVSGILPKLCIKVCTHVIIILIKNTAIGRRLEKVTKHPRVIYGLGDVVTSRAGV